MSTNVATELQRKDKADKQKKYEKEKSFLQLTEKHLDRDVHNAHIYTVHSLTLNLSLPLQAHTGDWYNRRSHESHVSSIVHTFGLY